MNSTSILVVEGKSDEAFYTELCSSLAIKASIKVAPPKALGGRANNKEGVFSLLPSMLNQLADGSLARLALVVDADFASEHGLGFVRTYERVTNIVSHFGFSPIRRPNINGLLFQNSDGLHDIGLWIMPNNRDEGMLEHWIKASIVPGETQLMQDVEKIIDKLAAPKFKALHQIKAEVATWLALQEFPGRGMESAVKEKLLDETSLPFLQLVSWIKHIYS
ncbi:hypothetical protein PO883_19420 [Massilia sp. DJPM01]|uniref:DUF3226 domain-containing protein n=1 Tax=Massilia sp. DJPM01 TaxID=3024404 RepID=UPI00259F31C5|nr:DUF3226 domain-containing protein [Massilia sp. DJPM01]MDM5179365.1 hypothetical protein [Massilia sp. DJPM01]